MPGIFGTDRSFLPAVLMDWMFRQVRYVIFDTLVLHTVGNRVPIYLYRRISSVRIQLIDLELSWHFGPTEKIED